MRWTFNRNPRPDVAPHPLIAEVGPRQISAAAVSLTDAGSKAWQARKSDGQWQADAWYQYDICGEMRFGLGWVGNAMSRAVLQAVEIDPTTGLSAGPTDNATARAIADSVLNGPAARAAAQSRIGLNLQVPGEVFTVISPQPSRAGVKQPDRWMTMSTSEITEKGGTFAYTDPLTGERVALRRGTDHMIRTWIAHPQLQTHADSAIRAALPILREIEKSSMNIAARLDSRLASNGILLVPQEIEFPKGDSDAIGAAAVMDYFTRAMQSAMKSPGTASAQVPIVFQVPADMVDKFKLLEFATVLDGEVLRLRTESLGRLFRTMDLPAEIMQGMGESSTNHWTAWQVEEAAYKIHVEPLLDRVADAYTEYWFHPALTAAKLDPARYALAFDVTDILSRPNRLSDILELHDRILVSDAYVLEVAGVPDTAAPTDEERSRRVFTNLLENNGSLLTNPGIARAVGVDPDTVDVSLDDAVDDSPALPAAPAQPRALPDTRDDTPDAGLVAAAELVIFDALSRAGGRLLTREHRGQHPDTEKFALHTVITVHRADVDRLLADSFQFAPNVADAFGLDPDAFSAALRAYATDRLTHGLPHHRTALAARLYPLQALCLQ